MTTISSANDAYERKVNAILARPEMADDNIRITTFKPKSLSNMALAAGAFCLALTVLGGFSVGWKHALASFQVGVMATLAIALGSLFWCMVWEIANAGWHTTVKRQWQNLAMQIPLCLVLLLVFVVIEIVTGGTLLTWMNDAVQGNHLITHKKPFLNVGAFMFRFLLYAAFWTFLAYRMFRLSREQDATGDRWLSQKARFMSGWGILVLALSSTFAAFDYMMAMDYRFFSTMWGVYYFAASAGASLAAMILVMAALRRAGKLKGVVGEEHFAELGKLLFGFCVFWAYIAFSQYFLIWYSNIPEETAWFAHRRQGGWEILGVVLILGRFVIPFLLLLIRPLKRNPYTLPAIALWVLVMHVMDMVFIIRPMVYIGELSTANPGPSAWWVDLVAIGGVFLIFTGVLIRRIGNGPLVPLRDPRLDEGLSHMNYIT